MAGAAGGMKDVPAEVAAHPLVFATLTAPSFGPVHAAKKPGRRGSRRCRPRSGDGRQLCPHGRPTWCMAVHDHDRRAGRSAAVPGLLRLPGHLVWQWWAPELWRRFTIALRRAPRPPSRRVGDGVPAAGAGPVREGGRVPTPRRHPLPRPDPARRPPHRHRPVPAAGRRSVDGRRAGRAGRCRPPAQVSCEAPPVDGHDVAASAAVRPPGRRPARPRSARTGKTRPGPSCTPKRSPRTWRSTPPKPPPTSPPTAPAEPAPARLKTTRREDGVAGRLRRAHRAGRPVQGLGPVGRHARLPRPLRLQVTALLDHPRPAPPGPPRPRPPRLNTCTREPRLGWATTQDLAELDETTLVVGSWRFAGIGWLTAGDAALAAASAARARDD